MKTQDIVRLTLLIGLGTGVFFLTRAPEDNGATAAQRAASAEATKVDFKFLARTKIDPQSPAKVAYPDDMAALDNQRISIVGFMAPFEEIDNMKKFMLLPSYVGCYFCAPPSFTQVLLIEQRTRSKDKLPFIDDPIIVNGTLRLYSKDSQHPAHKAEFVYAMDDAEVTVYKGADAPKKAAAAAPARKLGSAPAAAPAPTGATPHKAFQPQFLVASVSDLRKLPMLKAMKFEAVAPAEIERRVKDQVAASLPPEAWQATQRALVALGFAESGIDLQRAVTGQELARTPGIYDAKNDTLYYNNELQFSKPEARMAMVKLITDALLIQNVTFTPGPPLSLNDAALAAAALHWGDIERTAKVYDQNTRLLSGSTAPALSPPAGYPAISKGLQRLLEAPRDFGLPFVEKAFPADDAAKINAAYAKPPATTTEVIHPEYFLKSKTFTPKPVVWPNELLGDAKPLLSGSLGQAALSIWTGRNNKSTPSFPGWDGDRFAVWDGGPEGDAWVIETHWEDETAAVNFFTAAKASIGASAPDEDAGDTVFASRVNNRPFRVQRDGTRIIILGAGSDAKAAALVAQFAKPN